MHSVWIEKSLYMVLIGLGGELSYVWPLLRLFNCDRGGQSQKTIDEVVDPHPRNIVEAFPESQQPWGLSPIITFLVPITVAFSFAPLFLIWFHATHTVGATSDSDFWQLVQSSTMQLLSLLTMMLPTVSNVKLARQAWILTWILAGFSATCSIVAIPIYLRFPVEWSSTIAFAGSAAQAFVTLQFVYRVT
jgi:hypothetical protein